MSDFEIDPVSAFEVQQIESAKSSYKDEYFKYLEETVGPDFTGVHIQAFRFQWPGAPFVEGAYENAYSKYIRDLANKHDQLDQ
jgi:hypothetical protein